MVEERTLRLPGLPVMELDERAAHLDPPLAARGKAEVAVALGRLHRLGREEGDVVEVVLDVGLRLDEPEPKTFVHVEVRRAVVTVDLDPLEPAERLSQVVDPQRDVLESPLLPRPFLCKERELAAACVRADERELVGALDHVHREPLREEVRDRVAVGHPERNVVESLEPHPAPIYLAG